MHKKNNYYPETLQFIAFFISLLILSIPFTTAEFTFEQEIDMNLDSPGTACTSKAQDSKDFIKTMDNSLIKMLEFFFSASYGLCKVFNTFMSLRTLWKSMTLGFTGCCKAPVTGEAACAANTGAQIGEQTAHWQGVEGICQFIDKGFCQSYDFAGLNLESPLGDLTKYGVDPYESIAAAGACLNIGAILYNLRKLKTIKQVHVCCIEQSCAYGLSSDTCDKYLKESECIFYGMIWVSASKILISLALKYLGKKFATLFAETSGTWTCISSLTDLILVPLKLKSLLEAFDWVKQTMAEPNCNNLGFEEIAKDYKATIRGTTTTTITQSEIDTKSEAITSRELAYNDGENKGGYIKSVDDRAKNYNDGENQAAQNFANEATLNSLMKTTSILIDFIAPKIIEEQCKEQWSSSSIAPPTDTYTSPATDDDSSSYCTTLGSEVSHNCEITGTEDGMTNFGFTITNCKSTDIEFNIKLTGPTDTITTSGWPIPSNKMQMLSLSEAGTYTDCEIIII